MQTVRREKIGMTTQKIRMRECKDTGAMLLLLELSSLHGFFWFLRKVGRLQIFI